MSQYRAYQFDEDARVMGLPHILICDSDEIAVERAKLLDVGYRIEVWSGARLVARFQSPPSNTKNLENSNGGGD